MIHKFKYPFREVNKIYTLYIILTFCFGTHISACPDGYAVVQGINTEADCDGGGEAWVDGVCCWNYS